jgi:hypothetical protein
VFQRDLEELLIVVREQLIDFLFLAVALFALLEDEHGDRQRQANHRHHIAKQLPSFQSSHQTGPVITMSQSVRRIIGCG